MHMTLHMHFMMLRTWYHPHALPYLFDAGVLRSQCKHDDAKEA